MNIDLRKIFEAIVEPSSDVNSDRAMILNDLQQNAGNDDGANARYNNAVIGLLYLSGVKGADELEMDGTFGPVAERVFNNLCDALRIPHSSEDSGVE